MVLNIPFLSFRIFGLYLKGHPFYSFQFLGRIVSGPFFLLDAGADLLHNAIHIDGWLQLSFWFQGVPAFY